MPPVTLRTSRLSLTAEVPEPIAVGLRGLKKRVRSRGAGGAPRLGGLEFDPTRRQLEVKARDPEAAVAPFRLLEENPTRSGHHREPAAGGADHEAQARTALGRTVDQVAWYHTIELPDGIVTPGVYDHRPLLPDYPVAADLTGKRVLDIATADGFWAFEFERRGADVVAVDLDRLSSSDFPPLVKKALLANQLDRRTGLGFDVASAALSSKVSRVERAVYDLRPDDLGTFDLVHVADLLLHLENPVAALRAIRSVTSGSALIADCFDPTIVAGTTRYLGGWEYNTWWVPSLETLAQMVADAGFSEVSVGRVYNLAATDDPQGHWRAFLTASP